MYHTCLHCQKDLGANQAIEHLPIGRRVAFDGHKGRLWVVCGKCGRWNLVPFDDRWEALEECEKAYRGAIQRASSGQISLARLGEGLDLVRIGEPLRAEMASWRYGEPIRARRRRFQRQMAVGAVIATPIVVVGLLAAGGVLGASWGAVVPVAGNLYGHGRNLLVPALSVRGPRGERIRMTEMQVLRAGFRREDSGNFTVRLPRAWGRETWLNGRAARNALVALLAKRNQSVREYDLSVAVKELDRGGGPDGYLASANNLVKLKPSAGSIKEAGGADGINLIRSHRLLALEMALHEDNDRRAMEGELHLLLDAWREAEELAGISDRLAVPSKVEADLDRMKRGERPRP